MVAHHANGSTLDHLERSACLSPGTLMLLAQHLVLSVMFLNALIAIMGDALDRMQDTCQESMQLNWCQLVVELLRAALCQPLLQWLVLAAAAGPLVLQ